MTWHMRSFREMSKKKLQQFAETIFWNVIVSIVIVLYSRQPWWDGKSSVTDFAVVPPLWSPSCWSPLHTVLDVRAKLSAFIYCEYQRIDYLMFLLHASFLIAIAEPDLKIVMGAEDLLLPSPPLPPIERPVSKLFIHEK